MKKIGAERGTEMVEFAIAFPLFCVMALGSVELGWIFYQQSLLDYATRMGARYASVDTSPALRPSGTGASTDISTEAEDVIRNTVRQFGGTMPERSNIRINSWPEERTFALYAEETYRPITGSFIPYISNITKISSTVTMYCEACG